MDERTLTFNSPLTEEDWDVITDVDLDCTKNVWFHTKHGKDVEFVKVVRCADCAHRYVDGDNVRFNVCELNHNKVQSDNWFCADGERKSDMSLPTDNSDRCVCCGEPVPEGRMVCPVCERRAERGNSD